MRNITKAEKNNKEKKKDMTKNSKLKATLIVSFICLLFLGCGTLIIKQMNTYDGRFVKGVVINGVDVSGLTQDDAIETLSKLENPILVISDTIASLNLDLEEIVVKSFDENEIENVFNETTTFRNTLFGAKNGTYVIKSATMVDKEKLVEGLTPFVSVKTREIGKDAYIAFENSEFFIVKETTGTMINEELFVNYVYGELCESYENAKPITAIDVSSLDVYEKPVITKETLEEKCKAYNDNLSFEFEMDFYGNRELIDKTILCSWLQYDENNFPLMDENGSFTYDYDKVFETMNAFSREYYTYGKDIVFTTHDGEEKTIKNPEFGWSLKVDDTADKVIEQLKEKKTDVVYGIFLHKGVDYSKGLDSYVEVDIDDQYLYYYKNGELVLESDFVSGNYGTNDTNKGVFRLMYKTKNATLRGPGYASFVYYWMPFNSDGEGFHDATWRKLFGGEIYKGDGSHGCVNMPLENAKKLYNLLENDTIVIVY